MWQKSTISVFKWVLIVSGMVLFILGAPVFSTETQTQETDESGPAIEDSRVGNGQVWISLNGGDDVAYVGDTNIVEIWIENDDMLMGMSLGFEFNIDRSFVFDPVHGESGYVMEHNDAIGAFDLTGLLTLPAFDGISPDSILIGGAALAYGLPSNGLRLCYTMAVYIPPDQEPLTDGFCIDNIFIPPSGTWTFSDAGGGYPPLYQGNGNASSSDPTAPPVCFDIVEATNYPPEITNGLPFLDGNHCDMICYDFDAADPEEDPYWFELVAGPGTIDPATGLWCFTPSLDDVGSVDLVVHACDAYGCGEDWITVITITNNAPIIGNCIDLQGIAGTIISNDLTASDPDACDPLVFYLADVVPTPDGPMSILGTGQFQFEPTQADAGLVFNVDAAVMDGLEESHCNFAIEVLEGAPGVTISQVDFLYDYANVPNSDWGRIEVDCAELLNSTGYSKAYINAYIDSGWVIQNLIVDTTHGDVTAAYFDLFIIPGTDVSFLSIHLEVSDTPVYPFTDGSRTIYPVGITDYNAENASSRGYVTYIGSPPQISFFGPFFWLFDIVWRNQEGENVQTASNQCGPMGVANSLQWLENRYPWIQVPHDHEAGCGGDNTLVGQLDEHMGRTAASNPNNPPTRTDGRGVGVGEFIDGKFSYLAANGLQDALVHKHQGYGLTTDPVNDPDPDAIPSGDHTSSGMTSTDASVNGGTTWSWIYEELRKGQDVEIMFCWEDAAGNWAGSHTVRVFGAGIGADGPWIKYKHDAKQTDDDPTDTEGLEEVQAGPITDSDGDGLANLGSADREISFAFSESPKYYFPIIDIFQLDFILDDNLTANTDWGAVDLTFTGSENIQYFNLNIGGSWQVQNIPVLSVMGNGVAQTQRFKFDLGNEVGENVEYAEYAFELTDYPLSDQPEGSTVVIVGDDTVDIDGGAAEIAIATIPFPAVPLVGGAVADPVQHRHENFPNQEAGNAECAPTAVSNSLQFLNTKHNLGMNPDDITIARMKDACNWGTKTVASAPGPGVDRVIDPYPPGWDDPREIPGCWISDDSTAAEGERNAWWRDKAQYMQDNNLPITTRKLNANQIAQIIGEIDDGQDIEMEIGGHTVAVIGIADLGDGKYSVTIAHDKDQDNEGGTEVETGVWDSNNNTWSGDLAGWSLNYFIVECPKEPSYGEWSYHPRYVNGWLTVYGTINCQTIDPPIFERDYVEWCHMYTGQIPSWCNDYLAIFEWDFWCSNVDSFKVAVPYFDFGLEIFRLYPLAEWLIDNSPPEGINIPTIGDETGETQNIHVMVDLSAWASDPRPILDEYIIIDGECSDLPGYLIGTTPILFDPYGDAGRAGPFSTTPFTGILKCDGDLTLTIADAFVCGDANGDETVNILDITFLIAYLYQGGPPPDPLESADVNSDGAVNILDITYLIAYLYQGGPAPACP